MTLTASQRAIHRRILEESAEAKQAGGLVDAGEFPHLAALLKSARLEASRRRKLPARMYFVHEGRHYAAKFTSFGRIIVEKRGTNEVLAASGLFAA